MDLHNYKPDFSLLPSHIITCILRYLDIPDFKNASIICKSWYYASTDPTIEKTLIIKPTNANVTEIQKSNRRYGVLRLRVVSFDINDSHIELFEKICPYILELSINIAHYANARLSILLKLLELSTNLKVFHLIGGQIQYPGSFGEDFSSEAKVIKNISNIKKIIITLFTNIPLIKDLLKYAKNLDTFEFIDITLPCDFFTIFDNDNVGNIKNLHLDLNFNVDDFIKGFIKIKNLNLKWFKIVKPLSWKFMTFKSSHFQQFIMKLQSLDVLIFSDVLMYDQLSIICQNLVNLKEFYCKLEKDQKFSELENLKQLKVLCCDVPLNMNTAEIDNFFQCKFQYLQKFQFNGFVTESNLEKFCENHPNLIELKLSNLLTRKLEIIYKYLIKLQGFEIYFGFSQLRLIPVEKRYFVHDDDMAPTDLPMESEYNVSRLVDLKSFYVQEHSIRARDLRHLAKEC